MNNVTLVGNLGRDPEVRFTGNGTAVCTLNVATSERIKKDGAWVPHTEWHSVVVWGKSAENCGQYLAKGRKVGVIGKLRTRSWEKDGVKRYSTEVVADNVEFLSPGEGGGGGEGADAPGDDEIPFG